MQGVAWPAASLYLPCSSSYEIAPVHGRQRLPTWGQIWHVRSLKVVAATTCSRPVVQVVVSKQSPSIPAYTYGGEILKSALINTASVPKGRSSDPAGMAGIQLYRYCRGLSILAGRAHKHDPCPRSVPVSLGIEARRRSLACIRFVQAHRCTPSCRHTRCRRFRAQLVPASKGLSSCVVASSKAPLT